MQGTSENRTGRRRLVVPAVAEPEDEWGGQEDGRGEEVCEPEADVLLGVNHADLADQGADVDEEVEVHVDTRSGKRRVDNHTLSLLGDPDEHLALAVLLSNEGRDGRT